MDQPRHSFSNFAQPGQFWNELVIGGLLQAFVRALLAESEVKLSERSEASQRGQGAAEMITPVEVERFERGEAG